MADTRTAVPFAPPSPSSPTSPQYLKQPTSFSNRNPSLSFAPPDKQGRAASPSANGNGNGGAPEYSLSALVVSPNDTDSTARRDIMYGGVSPTAQGARSPRHRREASQASQLSQTSRVSNTSHASALSNALHSSTAPAASASFGSSPQASASLSPRLQHHQSPAALARRLSTDRRVRSEALPETRRHLSITGRRPSVLTGGYESSTDEDDTSQHRRRSGSPASARRQGRKRGASGAGVLGGSGGSGGQLGPPHGLPSGQEAGHVHAARAHLAGAGGGGRRRAQSLMVPSSLEFSPPLSPARRSSRLRPPGTGSPLPRTGSRTGSPGGRVSSDAYHQPLTYASTSRATSMRSVRTGEEEQARRDRKRHSSKMPAEPKRNNHLAESLGLGLDGQHPVLSPGQIQDLLSDVDVSSAMKMMAKPVRRQSSIVAAEGSSGQPQSPQPSRSSPPMETRPFLVSAPPPLTNGDWDGRHRGASVSSSVATPLRNVTPAGPSRRQRTLSMATTDSDGGHVPFTHHVPPTQQPESDIEEADETTLAFSPRPLTEAPAAMDEPPAENPTPASPPPQPTKHHKEKKNRLSGLFSLRRKHDRPQSPPPPIATPPPPLASTPRHDEAAAAQRERDAEMRRAEQERRDEELAQERRYRAMLQIHSHPYSQQRAQRVATHFDAFYSLVDQGIEQPPKVNPLAVIRWAKRTEEQKDTRRRWVEAQREGSELQPPTSPMSFPMGFHSGSSGGFGDSSRFLAGSPSGLRSSRSRSTTNLPITSPGWHYDVQDIQNYRACDGKVEFFIPPAPEVVEEHSFSSEPPADGSQGTGPEGIHVPPSERSSNLDEKLMDNASVVPIASPSLPSLLESNDPPGELTLSRTTSMDAEHQRPNFRTHRSHQSTGAIPPKPLQGLRVPFERAKGSLARRNVTTPASQARVPFEGESRNWQQDPPDQPSPFAKHLSTPHLRDSQHTHSIHSSHGQARSQRNPLRRRRHQDTPGTSDDEHHRMRGIIARGARGTMDILSRSGRPPSGGMELPATASRAVELQNLEQVFARERLSIEAEERRMRKTENELKDQAEERMQQTENDVYAGRAEFLAAAKHQLEQADSANSQMEFTITHFLTQLDDVRKIFRSAADIDVTFTGLECLRNPVRQATFHELDEAADSHTPLAVDSDRGYFSASGRIRRHPRRQSTLSPPSHSFSALPSFAYGLTAWPQRSTLDPTLGITTDPLRRLQLSCDKARTTLTSMGDERASATRTMQDMVGRITNFIQQKDHVRTWAKAANERIAALKAEKTHLESKRKGGVRPTMGPYIDRLTDSGARFLMSLFSYFIRVCRIFFYIVRSAVQPQLGWGTGVVVLVALLVIFWPFGGGVGGVVKVV